jgi:hypothetical protein
MVGEGDVKYQKWADAARYYRSLNQFERAHYYETALIEAGRCKRCGRLLTDPDSVERGYGPECVKKDRPEIRSNDE